MTKKTSQHKRTIIIAVCVAVLAALLLGWYILSQQKNKTEIKPPTTPAAGSTSTNPPVSNDSSTTNNPSTETSSGQSPSPAPAPAPAPASYSAYPQGGTPTQSAADWYAHNSYVLNDSAVNVYVEAKNIGGQAGSPTCTIKAQNANGTNSGTAVVPRPNLAPGAVTDFNSIVTISNQGARSVTQISVSCQ
jgi:cytoskeletal protein RodZ